MSRQPLPQPVVKLPVVLVKLTKDGIIMLLLSEAAAPVDMSITVLGDTVSFDRVKPPI